MTKKTVLLASAAVLAFSGFAYAGAAHPTTGVSGDFATHLRISHTPGSVTLWDQNGNYSGASNTSQNFESSFDQYDDQGADDFVVPKGHTWIVKEVDVTGTYRYTGSLADSVNVFFYKNKKGLPAGDALVECDALPTGDDGLGNFQIKLPKSCKVRLGAGKYFVSVQANMNLISTGSQWFWGVNTTAQGAAAVWQDPNGGWILLGVPSDCNTWQTLDHCLATPGDWMFALQGKDKS